MKLVPCLIVFVACLLVGSTPLPAEEIKRIPPPGIEVPAERRQELQQGTDELSRQIEQLRTTLKDKPVLLALLPDVQIYHNAVRYALRYDEFFNPRELDLARELLRQGKERADQLAQGDAPWTRAAGLVVRGYVSKIDGSVQPYGLVIPATFTAEPSRPRRLDIWFHGRGETLSEVNFLTDRQKSFGEFAPADTIVLHPYGRYCNANRFAGEVDTFEALADVQKNYPIDDRRITVRGFSMGGAACWQFATHHSGLWAAAAPGAGFSETAQFLSISPEDVPWYQRKLWHWYDPADYALNLSNCPTVAYSGGKDKQKQAADVMEAALRKMGPHLVHVVGPDTGHAYHPQAKLEVARRINSIAAQPREVVPSAINFMTYTLRYNRMLWLTIDGMEHHWQPTQINARILGPRDVQLVTDNVSAFTISMEPGRCPLDIACPPLVSIDSQKMWAPISSDRSWEVHFRSDAEGNWKIVDSVDGGSLRKRHGLQGPIDDAFMDSFIMVAPTGQPMNEAAGRWTAAEMNHAIEHWRRQFRGEARVKKDTEITADDIASSNLVLWGDPSSNILLRDKVLSGLPIKWDKQLVHVGEQKFESATSVPVLIYPNPLNPKRYVVLNSGFTFREYDYLNNARQSPKLPDWAVIDITQPPTPRDPGGIAAAGFFDEQWKLQGIDH